MKNKYQFKNIRQQITTCLLMLPLTFSLLAQTPSTMEVQGQINDGTSPIPGATVLIKGEQRGTVSDFNGRYSITAQSNDTLVISYIGYSTIEEPVNNRATINFEMKLDATPLREVVINAGYYNTTDRERTGSISRITAKDIEIQPVNNPLEALQGRMTGVDIIQTSGVAGSGFEVRIRGQNSIMAGNTPLYIIDGVPFDSQTLSVGETSGPVIAFANVSPLNAINPATIESIEVLKDADATAIYGSRGANGVVLITTKRGIQGKTQFTVNSSTGFSNITRKMDLLNTEQYLQMRQEAFANDGIEQYPANAHDINGTWDQSRYTDWQKVLIGNTAYTNSLELSVSGGNEQTRFIVGGMTQKETSVFQGGYQYGRITTNAKLNHRDANDRFQLALSIGYTLEDNQLPDQDFSSQAINLAPNAPSLYDDMGNINWENNTWTNPLARLNASYKQNSNTLFSNLVLSYNVAENLSLKVNAGYGSTHMDEFSVLPHTVYNPAFGLNSSSSSIIRGNGNRDYWIAEPQMEWGKSFGKNHFKVLLGTTFQENKQDKSGILAIGFANNSFMYNLGAADVLFILDESRSNYKYHSFFGRINYAFNDIVFFNVTGRRDGSSRFGSENRYGDFGALGVAWLFSEALQLPWLDFGKLRTSIGITGNDQIGDYTYLQNYNISDYPYDGNLGLLPIGHFNPHLKWEKNEKKEVGLDLGMFNQRLNLTVGYYNNRSSNQLVNYALPGTTGFTTIQSNLDALVENSGWEFEIAGNVLQSDNFQWKSFLNISLPNNKLLAFPDLENSTYANRYIIGESLQIVQLYKLNGVNPQTGLFEFEDYNGDGQLTALDDRKYIADLSPRLFGGFSNSFSYKNWALDIFLQFVKKDGYNQYRFSGSPGTMRNQPVSVLDRWQHPGDQATMQVYTTGGNALAMETYQRFTQSSGIISDASFIRLKSANISYNIPLRNTTTTCRLSIQGQNLLTFTNFEGGDPEQTRGFIPPMRRIVMGAQIQF